MSILNHYMCTECVFGCIVLKSPREPKYCAYCESDKPNWKKATEEEVIKEINNEE